MAQNFQLGLGDRLARSMAAADVLGRFHVAAHAYKTAGHVTRIASTKAVVRFDDSVLDWFSLSPDAAVDHLDHLDPVTRVLFDALTETYRSQAFTVAGITEQRLIDQVRNLLVDIVAEGLTTDDFRVRMNSLTDRAGVERLARWHQETVFRTNVQMAYSAGRLQQMVQADVVEALPFWQYDAVMDDRTRDNHAEMHLFQARHDDPVWKIWYPPCGFNCRCSVYPIMRQQADRRASLPGLGRIKAYPDEGFTGLRGIL